jgi:hypothetical protein
MLLLNLFQLLFRLTVANRSEAEAANRVIGTIAILAVGEERYPVGHLRILGEEDSLHKIVQSVSSIVDIRPQNISSQTLSKTLSKFRVVPTSIPHNVRQP